MNIPREFKEHKAELILNNELFLILDWRNLKNSEYAIRYILDKTWGTLIIEGDLGHAIARWWNKIEPEEIINIIKNDESYFKSKFQCSSDFSGPRINLWIKGFELAYKNAIKAA